MDIYKEYRDGSEEYLLSLFKKLKNINSYPVDLQSYIINWPTRYHLSHKRVNLLEGMKELFNPEWSVLELGAGTGALTLWLSEFFKKVDAVEGSPLRAEVMKARLKNRANVKIIVNDIRSISLEDKYDMIIIVGVLEYIPYFSNISQPLDACVNFLKRIKTYLNEKGILLLAIENKIGVKYLAGCTEDHSGKLFNGIADYPEHSPITFSRKELEYLLMRAGYNSIKFYHLFPDYKFPDLFLNDELERFNIDPSGWFRGNFEDYSGYRLYLYPDVLLSVTLFKAGLLSHFSNSFLVLCGKHKYDISRFESNWFIKKFWNPINIDPKLHHTIELKKAGGRFIIHRTPLKNGVLQKDFNEVEFHFTQKEEYIEGEPLIIEAYKKIMLKENNEPLKKLFEVVLKNLIRNFSTGKNDGDGYPLLEGTAIDYTLWNLIRTEKEDIAFIDRKWSRKSPVPVDFVLFRSLLYLHNDMKMFIGKGLKEFVIENIKPFFKNFDEDRFEKNIISEIELHNCIAIEKIDSIPEDDPAGYENQLICGLERIINEKQRIIDSIYSSRGWKVLSTYYKIRDKFLDFFKKMKR